MSRLLSDLAPICSAGSRARIELNVELKKGGLCRIEIDASAADRTRQASLAVNAPNNFADSPTAGDDRSTMQSTDNGIAAQKSSLKLTHRRRLSGSSRVCRNGLGQRRRRHDS